MKNFAGKEIKQSPVRAFLRDRMVKTMANTSHTNYPFSGSFAGLKPKYFKKPMNISNIMFKFEPL